MREPSTSSRSSSSSLLGLASISSHPRASALFATSIIRLGKLSTGFLAAIFLGAFALAGYPEAAEAATPEFASSRSGAEAPRVRDLPKRGLEEAIDDFQLNRQTPRSRTYPVPDLERVNLTRGRDGEVLLTSLPRFSGLFGGRVVGLTSNDEYVFFTLDASLQAFAQKLVNSLHAVNLAIVVMQPSTGRILAIAGKSQDGTHACLHAGYPAASLFKVVTAAAALEQGDLQADSLIRFRGGDYTLSEWNYKPSSRDSRGMSLAEALGKSCNPVFGRVGLEHLSPLILDHYARSFGFETDLGFDALLSNSSAYIPHTDFDLSRTAAGFGAVTISPVHAASLMSGIANQGLLPRPYLVEKMVSPDGHLIYKSKPEVVRRVVQPHTSEKLLEMMEYTTTIGTSRREFMSGERSQLNMRVAAKTGTLSGTNPKGVNHWFIAAAPIEKPEIAVAVVAVNPSWSAKASRVGRMLMQNYFYGIEPQIHAPAPPKSVKSKSYKKKTVKVAKKSSSKKPSSYAKKSSSKKSSSKASNKKS